MLKKIFCLAFSVSLLAAAMTSCSLFDQKQTPSDNYRNYYEIYVRSYSDSNGDHIGDLNGVLSKIDYLHAGKDADPSKSLGIDGVWLMPIFTSPSQHKYDVTDYYSIDPDYGTMEDFENLLDAFHERDVKVIVDMVLNHTSSEHPWFKQAVEALNNGEECKYINYYNFTKEPPLNEDGWYEGYTAVPGNEEGYYYESLFVDTMPDLNLADHDVIREIKDILRFWIDKGVDGYRLDACKYYFVESTEKSVEFLRMINDYCKSIKSDFYMIGEVWDGADTISMFYESGVDSFFNFDCSYVGPYQGLFNNIYNGNGVDIGKRAEEFNISIRNKNINAIDAPFISNHDTTRSATYLNNSADRKLAASLYMMLPGNSFIYYGEEIGMTDGWVNDSDKRLPIKWSATETGFDINPPTGATCSTKKPFSGVYEQLEDADSLLNHYRALIKLKNDNPEIQRAQVVSACDLECINVAGYTCSYQDSSVMVLHNITATPKVIDLKKTGYGDYSELRGFVVAEDYVKYEENRAYVGGTEYVISEMQAKALPITFVNGVITLPPRTTAVIKSVGEVNSTFITTTTLPAPEPKPIPVTPSDIVDDAGETVEVDAVDVES